MTHYSKKFLTVGSLLREPELLEYREKIQERDDISYPFYDDFDGYKETEEKATRHTVDKQVEHGLTQVSDGEQQRSLWHLDFAWGLDGIERYVADRGYTFDNPDGTCYETRQDIGLRVVGKLSGKNHPFIEHFKVVKDEAPDDVEVKHTIVAPGHIYFEIVGFGTIEEGDVYESREDFAKDLVKSYKEFIDDYVEVGGTILQMDDCIWSAFADDNGDYSIPKEDRDELANILTSLNNEVIDYGKSKGLKMYAHNCRGNYASRHSTAGAYSETAKYFLARQNYDRFYLEWDDDRAGSLEVLKVFEDRPDVEVVLGALSSKTNTLDDEERALNMLEEASQYIDKDNLYLSHQCGFASCDIGNELNEEEQWAKIDQGHEIAYKFFGE